MKYTIIILLFPVSLFGQFFFQQTSPASKYLVSEAQSTSTGENMPLSSGDDFSISMWVDLNTYTCESTIFDAGDIKVNLSAHYNFLRVEINLKDSVIVRSDTLHQYLGNDLINRSLNTHFVVTHNGDKNSSAFKLYINGDEVDLRTALNNAVSVVSSSSITLGSAGCKFQYYNVQVYDSELSAANVVTLYTDIENSLSPDVTLTGSDNYKQSGFLSNIYRTWRIPASGRLVSLPIWGGQKNPTSGAYAYQTLSGTNLGPYMQYNAADNSTYIATTARSGGGFSRDGYLLKYDHTNKKLSVISRQRSNTGNDSDSHFSVCLAIAPDSSIVLTRETAHNEALYVWRVDDNQKIVAPNDTVGVGSNLGYNNLFVINDTVYIESRHQYDERFLFYSTDNGQSFNGPRSIAKCGAGDWLYGDILSYNDSVMYALYRNRNASATDEYDQLFILKSMDGINYCDLSGARCEDVRTGQWDINELKAYAAIDSTTDGSNTNMNMVLDTMGRLHGIVNNEQNGLQYAYYDGSWNIAGITIDLPAQLVYKGGNNFDVFVVEENGGYKQIVKYSTSDFCQTLTGATVLYTAPIGGSIGINQIYTAEGLEANEPVLFVAVVHLNNDTEQSGLFVYEYNPWNQL